MTNALQSAALNFNALSTSWSNDILERESEVTWQEQSGQPRCTYAGAIKASANRKREINSPPRGATAQTQPGKVFFGLLVLVWVVSQPCKANSCRPSFHLHPPDIPHGEGLGVFESGVSKAVKDGSIALRLLVHDLALIAVFLVHVDDALGLHVSASPAAAEHIFNQ